MSFECDFELARQATDNDLPALADRLLSAREKQAFQAQDGKRLQRIWPVLAEARRRRRAKAAAGRIDVHTHTTASDGQFSVDGLLRNHFRTGQILINDHNIIDSLAEARRIVYDYDLDLDVFLGIEVICTYERRAFECNVVAPRLSQEFVALCQEHREHWKRACQLFLADLVRKKDFFSQPLWQQIAEDFSVGGDFQKVFQLYEQVFERIRNDFSVYAEFLHNNQTFDMGQLWHTWQLGLPGDPPQLPHRFFAAMRCYAMNAYKSELGDWFDYPRLMQRFHEVGCFVSHNHPNYWDDDFVGELPYQLQTDWIKAWAGAKTIDALEVWSPPFASQRVPHYWEKVCNELGLVPMAGTDCHSGREEEFGGKVENHPEIPPQIYAHLAAPAVKLAEETSGDWEQLAAWREVLEIDYAEETALENCQRIVAQFS